MITSTESALLKMIAARLAVPYSDLYNLIQFESGWNPKAANTRSTAKGLIQFTDSTAQRLGYTSSADLVKRAPTVIDQLPIVERYLKSLAPFPTVQSLYMAVFYPAARSWSLSQTFPTSIQSANPGIVTVGDYMRKAGAIAKEGYGLLFGFLVVGGVLWFFGRKK